MLQDRNKYFTAYQSFFQKIVMDLIIIILSYFHNLIYNVKVSYFPQWSSNERMLIEILSKFEYSIVKWTPSFNALHFFIFRQFYFI